MRWLIESYQIDARFCISIHDEVRPLQEGGYYLGSQTGAVFGEK